MGARSVSFIRPALEHDPHDTADVPATRIGIEVDETHALDAMSDWAPYYQIGTDATGMWWALRRDGLTGVAGNGPDALLAAIRADYAANPVTP